MEKKELWIRRAQQRHTLHLMEKCAGGSALALAHAFNLRAKTNEIQRIFSKEFFH